MTEVLTNFLKNLGCSYCQEYEFQENFNKENYKNWKLYLKEYEMYSAMILYNEKLDKNISQFLKKEDNVLLLDDKNNVILKLEYLIDSDDELKNAILIPTDEYQSFYENIEEMEKTFDDKLKAFAKGSYISDCVRKAKILTKYYRPRVSKYQTITLSKAIRLEEAIGFLTDPGSMIHNNKYEIKFLDEKGKVHPRSRELFVAIGEMKKFHDRIQKIINSEK